MTMNDDCTCTEMSKETLDAISAMFGTKLNSFFIDMMRDIYACDEDKFKIAILSLKIAATAFFAHSIEKFELPTTIIEDFYRKVEVDVLKILVK